MKLNIDSLKGECILRGWRFLDESGDGARFMVTSAHASVSVVGNLGGEPRAYANGTFDDVVAMVRAIAACKVG